MGLTQWILCMALPVSSNIHSLGASSTPHSPFDCPLSPPSVVPGPSARCISCVLLSKPTQSAQPGCNLTIPRVPSSSCLPQLLPHRPALFLAHLLFSLHILLRKVILAPHKAASSLPLQLLPHILCLPTLKLNFCSSVEYPSLLA